MVITFHFLATLNFIYGPLQVNKICLFVCYHSAFASKAAHSGQSAFNFLASRASKVMDNVFLWYAVTKAEKSFLCFFTSINELKKRNYIYMIFLTESHAMLWA